MKAAISYLARWLLAGTGIPLAIAGMGFLPISLNRPVKSVAAEVTTPADTQKLVAGMPGTVVLSDNGYVGAVLARQSVDVAARLDGRVDSVQVRLGDQVQQGAILATMDLRSLRSELAMASASLQSAEAEVSRAELELKQGQDRLTRLLTLSDGRPVVSGEELERGQYQVKISAARLSAAEAALQERRAHLLQRQQNLADGELRAPFSGTITARYVDPGAMVARSAPIVRLISSASLLVRFAIPEHAILELKIGNAISVYIEEPGVKLQGVIERIAPEVDAASRMVIVEASLGAPDDKQVVAGRAARVFTSSGFRIPPLGTTAFTGSSAAVFKP